MEKKKIVMLLDRYLDRAIHMKANHMRLKLRLVASVALLCLLGIVGNIEAKPVASGSGVVIDGKGHIVTNSHVVVFEHKDKRHHCSKLYVKGRDYKGWAKLVRLEPYADLAVIQLKDGARSASGVNAVASNKGAERKIQGWKNLARTMSSTDSEDVASTSGQRATDVHALIRTTSPKPGEVVIAYGYPFSFRLSDEPKVSTGVVSSVDGIRNDLTQFQHSAPINPGNSGGPLFDGYGRVLGIIVASLRKDPESEPNPQNVNFAIKGSIVQIFLETLDIPIAGGEPNREVSTQQVVERARAYTVKIICHQ